jgi:hypothetical protein
MRQAMATSLRMSDGVREMRVGAAKRGLNCDLFHNLYLYIDSGFCGGFWAGSARGAGQAMGRGHPAATIGPTAEARN